MTQHGCRRLLAAVSVTLLAGCAPGAARPKEAGQPTQIAESPSRIPSSAPAMTPTLPRRPGPPAASERSLGPPVQATCRLPLSTWTAEHLAGAVITAPVQLTDVPAAAAMVHAGIGGVILYGGPPPAALAGQLADLKAFAPAGWPVLVASDEEGGDVQRLRSLTEALPWPRTHARHPPGTIEADAARVGRALKALGVTVDFAPVADLDAGPGPDNRHPDGRRSYSAHPAVAAAAVAAFIRGLQHAGLVAVVKHFPGLGTATGNTDVGTAITAPWSQLQTRDLQPFRAAVGAGVKGVMTSNAVVPGLTSLPVSLSATGTAAVRAGLGFDGVVFTDSLSAIAVGMAGYSVPAAAVQALRAGADDVVFGTGDTQDGARQAEAVRAAIVAAVTDGTLRLTRLREAARHVAQAFGASIC